MDINPGGFSEAGISTTNLDGWVDLLVELGGYRELWRGESPDSIKPLWGLGVSDTIHECLLTKPGSTGGYIRLFQFENISQEEIRLGAHGWDSGGIFDINFRVPSLPPFVAPFIDRGWKGISRPVDWQFGDLQVREWLVRGPDAVIFALMERLAPPLQGWEPLHKLSHVFNSSQIVADIPKAIGFYKKLGFIEVLHLTGPLLGGGGEVLGLSPEAALSTHIDLVIMQPRGVMSGSVELVKIATIPGRNFAGRGLPHNLGLNMLRFPVRDLHRYAKRLESRGLWPVHKQIYSTRLEPFGDTEILAIQTPDGAWLEFYQAFTNPLVSNPPASNVN